MGACIVDHRALSAAISRRSVVCAPYDSPFLSYSLHFAAGSADDARKTGLPSTRRPTNGRWNNFKIR